MKFNITQHCGKWTAWWTRGFKQIKSNEEVKLINYCMIHFPDRFFVTEKEECKLFIYDIQFNTDQELNWFLLQWS